MTTVAQDEEFMRLAIEQAHLAALVGEVPVGAVLVKDGAVIAAAHNRPIAAHDPTAHAEIAVLRKAGAAIENYRLNNTTLYVTLEPCAMCAGAISFARVARLVFAAVDPKGGAVINGPKFFEQTTCHHRPEISQGSLADDAAMLLKDFFKARR